MRWCLLFALAGVVRAEPRPGDVFREHVWRPTDGKWQRITSPAATHKGAQKFLPNAVNTIALRELENATRVEVQLELLLSHLGTTGQAMRMNGGAWLPIPGPKDVPGQMGREQAPSEMFHTMPSVDVPLEGGGKGVMTVSQIATGEENALTLRVYAEKGAIKWAQENPNELELYRYGEERRTLTRGSGYLSPAAVDGTRVPPGHPEGYLEALATIYAGFARAVRAYIDARPLGSGDYDFPNVHDGVRGMEFIHAAVESANADARWVELPLQRHAASTKSENHCAI